MKRVQDHEKYARNALIPLAMSEARAVAISFDTVSLVRFLHAFNMREPETRYTTTPS